MSFLNPENIIEQLSLRGNESVADFGCGSGGWVIPLAKKLKDGQVYAIDVMEEAISALKSRTELEKVHNIRVICSDLDRENGSTLRDEKLDLVIISNILFQTEKKEEMIKESFRVLRRGGVLLVVDWLPQAASGPEDRTSPQEIRSLAEGVGFTFVEEKEAGVYHFAHKYEKV